MMQIRATAVHIHVQLAVLPSIFDWKEHLQNHRRETATACAFVEPSEEDG